MPCTAIITGITVKNLGKECGKTCVGDTTLCKIHTDSLKRHGPNKTALNALKATYKRSLKDLQLSHELDPVLTYDDYGISIVNVNKKYILDMHALKYQQLKNIQETGVDPDEEAKNIAYTKKLRRQEALRRMRQAWIDENERQVAGVLRVFPNQELGEFANDRQNVHTTRVVEHTKQIVARIREVPVPVDYRWDPYVCSKTPGEIISACRLSQDAAVQMLMKYREPEPIYDIEVGIYGKVLDSVWQFVLASPDKDDLVKIIKSELEDNIGMCAQGNLSRICNVVTGYMDGVTTMESAAELLGRMIPKLAEIDDDTERLTEVNKLLKESKLDITQWIDWVTPLFDEKNIKLKSETIVFDE